MVRSQPLVAVDDVEAASRWFQAVLGLESGHGGPKYEMLVSDGQVVAQLHQWEADEHPRLGNKNERSRGNGVLLWFGVENFEAILMAIEGTHTQVLDGPLTNPNSGLREVSVRGPEGYVVVAEGA